MNRISAWAVVETEATGGDSPTCIRVRISERSLFWLNAETAVITVG
jgi:hypothetical protein